jgi:hypothetical protein
VESVPCLKAASFYSLFERKLFFSKEETPLIDEFGENDLMREKGAALCCAVVYRCQWRQD